MAENRQIRTFERRLMVVGVLLFIGLWYVTSNETRGESALVTLRNLAFMATLAVLQWTLVHHVLNYFRKRYPDYSRMLLRVVLSVVVSGFLGMVMATLLYGIPMWIMEHRLFSFALFSVNFGPMFFFSGLIVGAEEVIFNFYELNRIEKEKEELKKAHLQSQLDSLKTQVNPHFLFNSLNTLLSLIPVSPQRAEKFVLELSAVYRYLLQSGEHQLTTVEKELQFAQSYFHLLRTRFEEGISLLVDVDPYYLDYQIPSLTLQLLLENAVKHNRVSPSTPLHITVSIQKEGPSQKLYLVVKNNLQRKLQAVPSTRMGLNHILSKFRLLNEEEVIITDKEGAFTVMVPLLKKQPA